YGPGAGGDATASAVIADIVDIVRGNQGPMLGYKKGLEGGGLELLPEEEIVTHYYLRMEVDDQSGVLAKVTQAFDGFGISIESMLQKPHGTDDRVKLLFTTHECQEVKIKEAIEAFKKLDCVHGEIAMMRIEK
ncbi:MAG TPA: ACT domain-containing protein, partial [Arcobacter sp.]|nr:ACT domain-containing protein [Arcobacter sp.]